MSDAISTSTRPDARSADRLDLGMPEEGGCASGDTMREAARKAGNSEILDQYARDYPLAEEKAGPHDQPQSMCPAFGSLRVGLRMKRTATVLSGSACCVYGLTFTSHFYGARRTVGYVPFSSETLVTGKLFEDIKEAVEQLADPAQYDTIIVTNLCVPTASGVPLRLLPDQINGVRVIGIDVPGFGIPTHAEAKDVLAGAMLKYAREEAEEGPVARPEGPRADRPSVALLGEMFPADPVGIGMMLELPVRLSRRANGASCTARSTVRSSPRSTPSTPPACASSRRRGARWSARLRSGATARLLGSMPSARPAVLRRARWTRPRVRLCLLSRVRSPRCR